MFLRLVRQGCCSFFALTFVLYLSAAQAQPAKPQDDTLTADVLFKKGKAELEAGNIAEACATIEASHQLAPRPGTLFTLAECYAQAKRPASAVVTYDEFLRTVQELPDAQRARYADRVKIAEEAKATVAKDVALLSIVVPKDAPKDLTVTRDGAPVGASLWGLPVPVDPGEHVVVVQVPGRTNAEQRVTLALRERRTLDVVVPAPPASTKVEAPPVSTARLAATYGTLGLGAAGLLVGGITGGLAWRNASIADAECKQLVCNRVGAQAVVDGRAMATWSTIGFAVGGAGLVAGAVLFLTLPKTKKNTTALDVMFDGSSGLIGVRGRF